MVRTVLCMKWKSRSLSCSCSPKISFQKASLWGHTLVCIATGLKLGLLAISFTVWATLLTRAFGASTANAVSPVSVAISKMVFAPLSCFLSYVLTASIVWSTAMNLLVVIAFSSLWYLFKSEIPPLVWNPQMVCPVVGGVAKLSTLSGYFGGTLAELPMAVLWSDL